MSNNQIDWTDWAWLAGFIDGEGTIRIEITKYKGSHKRHPSHNILITIANTRKDVLKFIVAKFGGFITKKSMTKLSRKQCYQYACHGKNTKYILENIIPYLKIKNKHAKIALEFAKTIIKNDGSRQHGVPPDVYKFRCNLNKKIKKLNNYVWRK